MVSFVKKGLKYFIGCKDDERDKALYIMLPKMSGYTKFFDGAYLGTRLGIALTHIDIFLITFSVFSQGLDYHSRTSIKYLGTISLIITLFTAYS